MTPRIVPGGFYVIGYAIVDHGQPIAVCPASPSARRYADLLTAKRLGELIDRHGLIDVPDTIAGVDG